MTAVLVASTIGAVLYTAFLLYPSFRGDTLPYTLVIISELFLILNGVLSFWTILGGRSDPRNFEFHHAQDSLFGDNTKVLLDAIPSEHKQAITRAPIYLNGKKVSVNVYITVYGEPLEEIRETAIAAKAMHGLHHTYILDDGGSDEVRYMAHEIGVGYIRRPTHEHAKAGNVNYALKNASSDFFVILDSDFVADERFLYETMPFFEDKTVAFVQTPQYYGNHDTFIADAAGYMQHVFYSLVQVGKNRFNAAFCVGTNVVFRRTAIDSVGGMYWRSKSEDIWTSLKLHEKGYRSVYINNVLAVGKVPETIKSYSKQQLRWATGSFEIFLHRNPLFNKALTPDQRIQYFSTTAFYFIGFAVMILMLLPALQIYFNLTPIAVDLPFYQWALLYSGFYVTQIILSMFMMGGFRAKTFMLAAVSFPVYVKAFFNALFRRDVAWQATHRVDTYDSPFYYMRAQVYMFLFLLVTLAVGIWKSIYTHEFSVSIAWCALNALIFGIFMIVALKESRAARKAFRSQRAAPPRRRHGDMNALNGVQL